MTYRVKFEKNEFIQILESSFQFMNEHVVRDSNKSRLQFLAEDILDFVTYDSDISEAMAKEAVEAIDAITERKNVAYFSQAPENEEKFLRIINTPFFINRLNWGTSARGAWWDISHNSENNVIDNAFLHTGEEQIEKLTFNNVEQWVEFMRAIVDWSKTQ